MTPQSLSIADLKAVIDYTYEAGHSEFGWTDTEYRKVFDLCKQEMIGRILKLIPPTEPKTEESK